MIRGLIQRLINFNKFFSGRMLFPYMSTKKIEEIKVREQELVDGLTKSPSDEKVNAFMQYLDNEWGGQFANNPKNWNRIRGIWIIVNESSGVTTAMKKKFRDWLMVKGLSISAIDREIIDNYAG